MTVESVVSPLSGTFTTNELLSDKSRVEREKRNGTLPGRGGGGGGGVK